MKIKRDSWHYKAAKFHDIHIIRKDQIGLCEYFWKVVFGVLSITGCVILSIAVGASILKSITYPIWQFIYGSNMGWAIFSVIVWLGVASFIHYMLYRDNHDEPIELAVSWDRVLFTFSRKPKSWEDKEPSLFVEWIKAKKQKICPVMEIE